MINSNAKTRPYDLGIEVPYIPGNVLLRLVIGIRYVDNGLSTEERDAAGSRKLLRSLRLAAMAQWLIPGAFVMVAVGAVSFWNATDGSVVLGGGAIMLAAGILSEMHLRKEKKRLDMLTDGLEARGVLARPLENGVVADLHRINAVLQEMHHRGDTSLDEQARAAVDKVVNQNVHRPTTKQKAIAASDAKDEATLSLRSDATDQAARWAADVADAELAIRGLEAACTGVVRE
jgi:hypothetical protein